jgi:hypothetical protein
MALTPPETDGLGFYARHRCVDATLVASTRRALYRRTLGLVTQLNAEGNYAPLRSLLNHVNVAKEILSYVDIALVRRLELIVASPQPSSEYVRRAVHTHSEFIGASVRALLLQRRAWQTEPCAAGVVHTARFVVVAPVAVVAALRQPSRVTSIVIATLAAVDASVIVQAKVDVLEPLAEAPTASAGPSRSAGHAAMHEDGVTPSDAADRSAVLPWGVHGVYRGNTDLSRLHVAPGGVATPSRYTPRRCELSPVQARLLERGGRLQIAVRHIARGDGEGAARSPECGPLRSSGIAVLHVEGVA